MVGITARLRSVYGAALAPNRGPDRTDASASRTLLAPELSPRAGNFAAALGIVRARTFAGQKPAHRFVQQMRIHWSGAAGIGQFHLPKRSLMHIPLLGDAHEMSQLLGTLILS